MDPTRKVRILALAGVATMAAGGVAASGCDFDDSGCATPDPPAIGMGVGLVVTGAALLGVALVMRKGRAPGAVLMRKPTPGPLNPTLP